MIRSELNVRLAASRRPSQPLLERCRNHQIIGVLATLVIGMPLLGLLSAPASTASTFCDDTEGSRPHLEVATKDGSILIALHDSATKHVLGSLLQLIRGPIFNPDFVGEKGQNVGYYDGLSIGYTKPHVEIRTSERPPKGLVEFETEIDAEALGLHQKKIANSGEAMDVFQLELRKIYSRESKKPRTPQMKEWLDKFRGSHDADFLIGVSRKEINEALGHSYKSGLDSRPVTKGAVMLKPASPKTSSPVLSIALTDIPERTGIWMVIGQVADGLEFADQLSVRELVTPRHTKPIYRPRDAVVIESIRLICKD